MKFFKHIQDNNQVYNNLKIFITYNNGNKPFNIQAGLTLMVSKGTMAYVINRVLKI